MDISLPQHPATGAPASFAFPCSPSLPRSPPAIAPDPTWLPEAIWSGPDEPRVPVDAAGAFDLLCRGTAVLAPWVAGIDLDAVLESPGRLCSFVETSSVLPFFAVRPHAGQLAMRLPPAGSLLARLLPGAWISHRELVQGLHTLVMDGDRPLRFGTSTLIDVERVPKPATWAGRRAVLRVPSEEAGHGAPPAYGSFEGSRQHLVVEVCSEAEAERLCLHGGYRPVVGCTILDFRDWMILLPSAGTPASAEHEPTTRYTALALFACVEPPGGSANPSDESQLVEVVDVVDDGEELEAEIRREMMSDVADDARTVAVNDVSSATMNFFENAERPLKGGAVPVLRGALDAESEWRQTLLRSLDSVASTGPAAEAATPCLRLVYTYDSVRPAVASGGSGPRVHVPDLAADRLVLACVSRAALAGFAGVSADSPAIASYLVCVSRGFIVKTVQRAGVEFVVLRTRVGPWPTDWLGSWRIDASYVHEESEMGLGALHHQSVDRASRMLHRALARRGASYDMGELVPPSLKAFAQAVVASQWTGAAIDDQSPQFLEAAAELVSAAAQSLRAAEQFADPGAARCVAEAARVNMGVGLAALACTPSVCRWGSSRAPRDANWNLLVQSTRALLDSCLTPAGDRFELAKPNRPVVELFALLYAFSVSRPESMADTIVWKQAAESYHTPRDALVWIAALMASQSASGTTGRDHSPDACVRVEDAALSLSDPFSPRFAVRVYDAAPDASFARREFSRVLRSRTWELTCSATAKVGTIAQWSQLFVAEHPGAYGALEHERAWLDSVSFDARVPFLLSSRHTLHGNACNDDMSALAVESLVQTSGHEAPKGAGQRGAHWIDLADSLSGKLASAADLRKINKYGRWRAVAASRALGSRLRYEPRDADAARRAGAPDPAVARPTERGSSRVASATTESATPASPSVAARPLDEFDSYGVLFPPFMRDLLVAIVHYMRQHRFL